MLLPKLSYKFDGYLYGTYYYGYTDGIYLRGPFWKTYTDFEKLRDNLGHMYNMDHIVFPQDRSIALKWAMSSYSGIFKTRLAELESFLSACCNLPLIWENSFWVDFVNPFRLERNCYYNESYRIKNLIEYTKNIQVYRVVRSIDNAEYAIKSIDLSNVYIPQVRNEIQIHQKLNYKHCLKFYGYKIENYPRISDPQNLDFELLSQELNSGTDDHKPSPKLNLILEVAEASLLETLETTGGLDEAKAKRLFYQLMLGVSYLHHHGVVHRDIKPQNLLIMKDGKLKICDFGLSYYQGNIDRILPTAKCGSTFYAAPELFEKCDTYDGYKTDIWACGVVLFSMLAGERQFNRETISTLSIGAQDMLKYILKSAPEARPTCIDILTHPWLRSVYTDTNYLELTLDRELAAISKSKRLELSTPLVDVIHEMSRLSGFYQQRQPKVIKEDNVRGTTCPPKPPPQ